MDGYVNYSFLISELVFITTFVCLRKKRKDVVLVKAQVWTIAVRVTVRSYFCTQCSPVCIGRYIWNFEANNATSTGCTFPVKNASSIAT